MNNIQYNELLKISKDIWNCKICDFHRVLESKKIDYRPDAPLDFSQAFEYRTMAVGINPGWSKYDNQYLYALYKQDNFIIYQEELKRAAKKRIEEYKHSPYMNSISKDFNFINKWLEIYKESEIKDTDKNDQGIKSEKIYDYVFWANLSFCNSQNPWKREFDDIKLPCRVYSEEIPNCIKKGYLKNMIKQLHPKLILFFTSQAIHYMYFKLLLSKLFDNIDPYNDIITPPEEKTYRPAQNRANGNVIKTQLIPCKVKVNGLDTQIIFLPHPSYRFKQEHKDDALEYVCNWLKKRI